MAKITLAFRKETVNSVSTNFYRQLILSTSRSGILRHLCQNQSGTKKSYCANVCASTDRVVNLEKLLCQCSVCASVCASMDRVVNFYRQQLF